MKTNLRVLSLSFEGKCSENAIYQKLLGLKSKEEDRKKHSSSTTLKLPNELPSVENTLKTLSATVEITLRQN